MKARSFFPCGALAIVLAASPSLAETDTGNPKEEVELLKAEEMVVTPSRHEQPISKSPANVYVITGLLFMCLQAGLANQFEYLQSQFANNVLFPSPRTGLDPSIGQSNSTANVPQKWPPKWGNAEVPKTSFDFSRFVALKGGEYFFTPSISFLKNL